MNFWDRRLRVFVHLRPSCKHFMEPRSGELPWPACGALRAYQRSGAPTEAGQMPRRSAPERSARTAPRLRGSGDRSAQRARRWPGAAAPGWIFWPAGFFTVHPRPAFSRLVSLPRLFGRSECAPHWCEWGERSCERKSSFEQRPGAAPPTLSGRFAAPDLAAAVRGKMDRRVSACRPREPGAAAFVPMYRDAEAEGPRA